MLWKRPMRLLNRALRIIIEWRCMVVIGTNTFRVNVHLMHHLNVAEFNIRLRRFGIRTSSYGFAGGRAGSISDHVFLVLVFVEGIAASIGALPAFANGGNVQILFEEDLQGRSRCTNNCEMRLDCCPSPGRLWSPCNVVSMEEYVLYSRLSLRIYRNREGYQLTVI